MCISLGNQSNTVWPTELRLFLELSIATLVFVFSIQHASAADQLDLEAWFSSEARAELISEFEANSCRLTLIEVSDLLFEYDASEENIYAERLILMEPEGAAFSFPVVLKKGAMCEAANAMPIVVPVDVLLYAGKILEENACVMEVAALESLDYPADLDDGLSDSDRRNVVSELYNRGDITFLYNHNNGVATLNAHKLTGKCEDTQ